MQFFQLQIVALVFDTDNRDYYLVHELFRCCHTALIRGLSYERLADYEQKNLIAGPNCYTQMFLPRLCQVEHGKRRSRPDALKICLT